MSKHRYAEIPVGDSAFRLHPTSEGKEKLDRIRDNMSKKGKSRNVDKQEPEQIPTVTAETVDVSNFKLGKQESPTRFDRRNHDMVKVTKPNENPEIILDKLEAFAMLAVRYVSGGQYQKLIKSIQKDDILRMNWFLSVDTFPDAVAEQATRLRQLFLRVAKSFYEYSDPEKNLVFLTDGAYDKLLAMYLKTENAVEPSPIIPKGKKEVKKVPIVYQTLHNNMDKAYRIYESDEVPTGVKEQDSIEKFLQRAYQSIGCSSEHKIKLELSPKIDGVSINGTLDSGTLRSVQTRGDASESVSVPGLDQIVLDNTMSGTYGVQFEAFVTDKDRIDASEYLGLDEPYISCRHAAAGIMSRLSIQPDPGLLPYLKLFPIAAEGGPENDYVFMIKTIQKCGVVPKDIIPRTVVEGTMKQLLSTIRTEFQHYSEKRGDLSYAIDGMVITIIDADYQRSIGREGRTNKYQIALKFNPTSSLATVTDIWLDTGRKGYRTIQVNLDKPIYLDGVKYDHVPVLSAGEFDSLGLREGSVVRISRVGDVIPSISMIDSGKNPKIQVPTVCPTCGGELVIKAKKLYCKNPDCEDNIVGRILGFITSLEMVSYGRSFVSVLHDTYKVRSISDLFTFDVNVPGVKAGKKLLGFKDDLISAVRRHNDIRVVAAMGIPGIGTARAKELLAKYPLSELKNLNHLSTSDEENLRSLVRSIVGPETECYAMDILVSDRFSNDIAALIPHVTKLTMNFNFEVRVGHTGISLSKKFREFCEHRGFEIVDGKNFTVLIAQSHDTQSGKAKAARKRGVPILTESEFLEQHNQK